MLRHRFGSDFEILVVDDNSPDGTARLVGLLASACPTVEVMVRTTETGLSSAVVAGWRMARGTWLGVLDGDGQHPGEAILDLLDALAGGADLAVASRHVGGGGVSDWSIRRRIVSRSAQALGLMLAPTVLRRVSDPLSGYFVVRRSVVAGRPLNAVGYKILLEVLGRGAAQSVVEVPYTFRERPKGGSKLDHGVITAYVRQLIQLAPVSWRRLVTTNLRRLPRGSFFGS